MTLLLLLACGREAAPWTPSWTPEGALAPHLARLDTDGDGRVTEAEYTRTRREGPPFATADRSGDGALAADELVWLVRAQSPTTFDGDAAPLPAGLDPADRRARTGGARDVWELLTWMGDSLRAAGAPGPDPAAVEAAVNSASLDSAETRAVLAAMRPGWEGLG
ncbi:MAG: hypothetical protein V4850_36610, partial [Myxococcota bacterium]